MNVDLVQLAGRRERLAADGTVDPVTAEVIRSCMETVCFEMATYVSRTATTPILNQSNERNATILDAGGRLAALSVGIPQFMLTSTLPVRFALDFLGADEFHEGDVFVANDPYHGGGHLPDYNVFSPAGPVTVEVAGHRQTKYLQAGSGFLSQHTKELFFGLGELKGSVRAAIRWASGLTQEFENLPANHRLEIEEGSHEFRIDDRDV